MRRNNLILIIFYQYRKLDELHQQCYVIKYSCASAINSERGFDVSYTIFVANVRANTTMEFSKKKEKEKFKESFSYSTYQSFFQGLILAESVRIEYSQSICAEAR